MTTVVLRQGCWSPLSGSSLGFRWCQFSFCHHPGKVKGKGHCTGGCLWSQQYRVLHHWQWSVMRFAPGLRVKLHITSLLLITGQWLKVSRLSGCLWLWNLHTVQLIYWSGMVWLLWWCGCCERLGLYCCHDLDCHLCIPGDTTPTRFMVWVGGMEQHIFALFRDGSECEYSECFCVDSLHPGRIVECKATQTTCLLGIL